MPHVARRRAAVIPNTPAAGESPVLGGVSPEVPEGPEVFGVPEEPAAPVPPEAPPGGLLMLSAGATVSVIGELTTPFMDAVTVTVPSFMPVTIALLPLVVAEQHRL